ncbi:Uncharacterized protein YjbI, contains pentapeptide repeats [Geodermatophilus siccatus]|uniref:Uncharacterized protein YjbI, contains pentapeptide repeats n=1 Tax=Geodermatophilus siccatus TaxID=1137991 RepID=A0A1H0BTY2_9ACTN|nr:pentapeptide repeat-containing protein [Geodermatophilus siccatus]SDN49124.1 Uncharacterized protein YjbI, contains pentapeptide repeats [Geodermatophilus siccatus]
MADDAAPVETGRPNEERGPRHWLWSLAGVVAVAILLFVLWWGPWLFTRHPSSELSDAEELKAENDVRTTLVQTVAGLAVAAGAFVTYRTFRQNQLEQANRHDREERTYKLNQSQQVTDTYTKAVEQLGHKEAPVRLGALYSLVSLAQDNPPRRQTVVDVLCAYLRMPYTPSRRDEPTSGLAATNDATPPAPDEGEPQRDTVQELQVRQTAQRLLADHLHYPPHTSGTDAQGTEPSPEAIFWPGISIDLTGASLVDLSLRSASVIRADFSRATFSGDASFDGATFSGDARFDGATFSGDARFDGATFSGDARFDGATFSGDVWFGKATFFGDARFDEANFHGYGWFEKATVSGDAWFGRATFSGHARFDKATFSGDARFDRGTFSDDARFIEATVSGDAWFGGATFSGAAWFGGATFSGNARFGRASFSSHASFSQATFSGYAWFGKATFSGNARFDEAAFSGHASFDGATFSGHALFDKAIFSGKAWFHVTLSGHASFGGTRILRLDDPEVNGGRRRVWPNGWAVHPDADDPARGTLVRVESTAEDG